jgi:hypothetical protein
MVEGVRTSETSFDNHFTRQYIPEDNSELHGFTLSGANFAFTSEVTTSAILKWSQLRH